MVTRTSKPILTSEIAANWCPNAHADLQTITTHLNENVRRQERSNQLAKLEKKGIPYEKLLAPHRYLLRADTMTTAKGSSRYVLLFNDILVHLPKVSALWKVLCGCPNKF